MVIKINNYTFKGMSIGSRRTCIYIPELKVAFDMGYICEEIVRTQFVCISHGHADHISCLLAHERLRNGNKMIAPTYIMPEVCLEPFRMMHSCMRTLDKGLNDIILYQESNKYRGYKAEDCLIDGYPLNGNYRVKSLKTIHKIPSYGYVIYDERQKLKEEYKSLSGKEIAVKRKVEDLFDKLIVNEIAYTGDTVIEGVLQHSEFLNAEILLLECTFFEDVSPTDSHSYGHIHIKDIENNITKFNNKYIILFHFSARYQEEEILEKVEKLKTDTGRNIYAFLPDQSNIGNINDD